MEEHELLVEAITRQVLAALAGAEAPGAKPRALLLGAGDWGDLREHYTLEGVADYERTGSLAPYALVLLDHVAPTLLADLALGRGNCAVARAVSEALLTGKAVYLAEEGVLHRAQYTGANPGYFAMLEEYTTRLASFGVHLGKRQALTRLLTQETDPPCPREQPAAPKPLAAEAAPKLLTAEAARKLCQSCGGVLTLAPGTVITPLARDVLRDQRVRLEVGAIC